MIQTVPSQQAEAARPTPVFQARGLVKRYGQVTALDGADFELYPGEILAEVPGHRVLQIDLRQRGRHGAALVKKREKQPGS